MAVTYTPTTNFGAKDSLPQNDPSKVIKGSEFSVEFTAIQTAFSLAAPVASPTFTGTVTIPTADVNGGNIDGTVIGAATPAAGSFTTGSFSNNVGIGTTSPGGHRLKVEGGTTYLLDHLYIAGGLGKMVSSDSASNPLIFGRNASEDMRIDSSGNVLVGLSSSTNSAFIFETDTANNKGSQINTVVLGKSSSGYPIVGYNCAPTGTTNTYNKYRGDFASWIHFASGRIDTFTTTTTANGTTTGTAGPYLSRGGTSWTSSSDRRLKDNIEGITYGLEAVKSLNPVSYVRNDRDTGVKELGFIAQEVDEIVSEVVSVREDGFYGIDYERLIPVLTKAIQEQQEIINDLRARVAQLEGA